MAGDEVDALLGFALLVTEEVGAAESRDASADTVRSSPFHEAPHVVAKLSVPFLPRVANEPAHLIEALPASHASAMNLVPASSGSDSMSQRTGGFGNGCPVSSRVRIDARSKRKAVDVHLGDPVAQAVLNEAAHDRVIGVQVLPQPV
jgi:hypothetical protein